jgi:TRAP-type mannitol/chloroaromatic compound transport system substrate-binding protein
MKRREMIQSSLIGATALATACGGPNQQAGPSVHTTERVRWRLASSFPRSLDTLYGSAEVLAKRVSEMTNGQFEIMVHPGGELVPPLEVMEAVQQGSIQIGHTASYYYIGKNPALAFDCCVPFGLSARQQAAWLNHEGQDLTRELFSDFNIINFPAGNTGTQMGGWFKNQVNGLADLQGLKMRIPGMGGKVMSEMGVAVQTLAGGEIYTALERGAIDATEWVGPYDDEQLGFYKVAKLYYYPGWWEPGPSLSFYVNQGEWAKLSAEYKAIFQAAAREAELTMLARYDIQNPQALSRLIGEGVQVIPFADDILRKAKEISIQLLEENAANDAAYAKVFVSWKKAQSDMFQWFNKAEALYAKAAYQD